MDNVVQEVRIKREWEELISEGMEAREKKDDSQWLLGDLALEVMKSYGEDAIGKFAYGISVPKKTIMNYRTIAGRFNGEIRHKYKKLSWSHFEAVSAVEKPEAWLEKADNEELSVEMLRSKIKEAYPSVGEPDLNDDPPEVYKCPQCGLWRLKDTSSLEICKGHYKIKKGKIEYE